MKHRHQTETLDKIPVYSHSLPSPPGGHPVAGVGPEPHSLRPTDGASQSTSARCGDTSIDLLLGLSGPPTAEGPGPTEPQPAQGTALLIDSSSPPVR